LTAALAFLRASRKPALFTGPAAAGFEG